MNLTTQRDCLPRTIYEKDLAPTGFTYTVPAVTVDKE